MEGSNDVRELKGGDVVKKKKLRRTELHKWWVFKGEETWCGSQLGSSFKLAVLTFKLFSSLE